MIIKYDALDRAEIPVLTLCNPGSVYNNGTLSNAQCILTDTSAEELVLNFNSTSELNFVITKVDHEEYDDESSPYALTQNRRLIFVQDIGYFLITNVSEEFQGDSWAKSVTARSCEAECEQRQVPFIEDGTYRFLTSGNEIGLLNTIVSHLPLWTIGTVDQSVASRYRTFSDVSVETNCLSFMLQDMQDAYECIFIFDIINRVINVYSQDNYVVETNIHITPDDVINSITITENADDVYTAISAYGQNNLTISAINPTGQNTLYNFDYYKSWMTPGLASAVESWQSAINNAKTAYYAANLKYFNDMTSLSNYQFQVNAYKTQLSLYKKMRDNLTAEGSAYNAATYNTAIVNAGGTPITISSSISAMKASIDAQISLVTSAKNTTEASASSMQNTVNADLAAIDTIHNQVDINAFLTADQVEELANYIYEGSYSDEYITTTDIMTYAEQFAQMKALYDRAEKQLAKVSVPTQEFSVDSENFIFEKRFANWSEQIETGCLINVELHENDVAKLFLTNITVNYDDKTLSMTFGNRFNRFDPKALFEDVLGSVNRSANAISFMKETIYPIKNGELDDLATAIITTRDLTLGAALSSQNENVDIDETGYTARRSNGDGTFDPKQLKITSRNIMLTDDAWESSRVAIGEIQIDNNTSIYGINADTVIAGIIVGSTITGGSITGSSINNGNGTFSVDSNGNLTATSATVTGTINATLGGSIGGFTLETDSIHTKNIAITNNASNSVGLSSSTFTRTIDGVSRSGLKFGIGSKFGVTSDGTLYAGSANISGKITANDGTIGDWGIDSARMYKTATITKHTFDVSDIARMAGVINGSLSEATVLAQYPYYDLDGDGHITKFDSELVIDAILGIIPNGVISSATTQLYPSKVYGAISSIYDMSQGIGFVAGPFGVYGTGLIGKSLKITKNIASSSGDYSVLNPDNLSISPAQQSSQSSQYLYENSINLGGNGLLMSSVWSSGSSITSYGNVTLNHRLLRFQSTSNVDAAIMYADQSQNMVRLFTTTSAGYVTSSAISGLGALYRAFILMATRGAGAAPMVTTVIPLAMAKTCTSSSYEAWAYCAQNAGYQATCYFNFTNNTISLSNRNGASDNRAEVWGLR